MSESSFAALADELEKPVVKRKPPSKAKIACDLIDAALEAGTIEMFTSCVDETPYATIHVGEHVETQPVKGGGFSKYLRRVYWDKTDEPLHGDSLSAALAHAEMRALLGEQRELHARVAHLADTVVVDDGGEGWGAYVIGASGWTHVTEHPVPFVRSRASAPYAIPTPGRPLLDLLELILGVDEETAQLLAAWVVCSYCAGPYLIGVLHGEQGSGKSTTARLLRALTDPSAVPLRIPPREARDLIVAARSSHVLAYDNLSGLPQWLSDTMSAIATGGGYEARQLHTDLDEVLVQTKRPILINGIENPAVSADLLDRSLVITMVPIRDDRRRSEDEIEAQTDALRGELVGAVFTAISGAISSIGATPAPTWARMVDATRWATAAAAALGTSPDRLEATLKQNRSRRDELVLEGSLVAAAMLELAIAKQAWFGTTAELHKVLESETEIGEANAGRKTWPQSVQALTAVIARELPILRRQGVEWEEAPGRRSRRGKMLTYRDPDEAT